MKFFKKITIIVFSLLLIFDIFLFKKISTTFGYTPKLLINTIYQAKKESKKMNDNINFLILGLDKRDDWLEKNQDTDTIIFANLNTNTLDLKLIPLPRDIWFKTTSTRINKIYQLSFDQVNSFDYIKTSFGQIIGQKIDHIIILDTQVMLPFINAIGSVEIELDYPLIDKQYPNPDYIADPKNHPDPYMTINFDQGKNIIDDQNVLYFIRSRKSTQTSITGGTDIGRSQRQQLLLKALISKIIDQKIYLNLSTISSLYQIWSQQIIKDIDDQTLLALFIKNIKNMSSLNLESIYVPIGLSRYDSNGVIYHPNYFKNRAWVYLPTQADYSSLHLFVDQQIN